MDLENLNGNLLKLTELHFCYKILGKHHFEARGINDGQRQVVIWVNGDASSLHYLCTCLWGYQIYFITWIMFTNFMFYNNFRRNIIYTYPLNMLKYQGYLYILDYTKCISYIFCKRKCSLEYNKISPIWQRRSKSHGFHYLFSCLHMGPEQSVFIMTLMVIFLLAFSAFCHVDS